MEQDETKGTNLNATIDSVSGLVKAVPVYQDAIQPAAKQIGQTLETVSKTVNIALAPIKALVWGYEKIEDFITNRVSEKLKNIPEENITTPPPQVAGPTIEALRYSGHDPNLRELYANLLATAMDKETIHKAHPGFVEIIKNLTSDEATLIQVFKGNNQYPIIDIRADFQDSNKGFITIYSNYSHLSKIVVIKRTDLIPTYLDNLCRLGILEIPSGVYLTAPNTYEPLETSLEWESVKELLEKEPYKKIGFERKLIKPTAFGKLFIENVVNEKK
ncbi:MAG: DUF4393 domain-containing protein [Bacteroidales bacterium]|nr:DUF4393 domain-containing protein [Bacteroidales bacterium]